MKSSVKYTPLKTDTPNPVHTTDTWSPSADLLETQKKQETTESSKNTADVHEELSVQLEQSKKLKDELQRKQAELDNMRKRHEREKQEIASFARGEVLHAILEVADACERASASLYTSSSEGTVPEAFRAGLELIGRKLQDNLAKFHVTPILSIGQTFNPHCHEAMMREETDQYQDQQIIFEFLKGYLINGRLLRPAQVKVAVSPKSDKK
jgi:molecular chaperone GrpE